MLVRPNVVELLEGHPYLDEILPYSDNGSFWKMLRTIKREKFDIAVVARPTMRLALLLFLARIPIRLGTGYRWYSLLFNRRGYEHRRFGERHEVDYNLNLVRSIGCGPEQIEFHLDIPNVAQQKAKSVRKRFDVGEDDRLVILHPGSGGSALDWSPDNFGELGRRLISELDAKVIVTGGRGEAAIVQNVLEQMDNNAHALVGELTLKEYAALISSSSLFISNSTGPIHIAAAVGTEVIGFYPPIKACSAVRWGPYTNKKRIFVPNVPGMCHACTAGKCSYYNCMDMIRVEEVFRAAKKVLTVERVPIVNEVI
jgi:heptosyltransferase-2